MWLRFALLFSTALISSQTLSQPRQVPEIPGRGRPYSVYLVKGPSDVRYIAESSEYPELIDRVEFVTSALPDYITAPVEARFFFVDEATGYFALVGETDEPPITVYYLSGEGEYVYINDADPGGDHITHKVLPLNHCDKRLLEVTHHSGVANSVVSVFDLSLEDPLVIKHFSGTEFPSSNFEDGRLTVKGYEDDLGDEARVPGYRTSQTTYNLERLCY